MEEQPDQEMWDRIFKQMEEGRQNHDLFLATIINVRMKFMLEGFRASGDEFILAPDLRIKKADLNEREVFYQRVAQLVASPSLPKENEFFAEFDFEIPRSSLQGLAPSESTTLVATFFAIASKKAFNINKGQFYGLSKQEPQSFGVTMIGNEMRNPPRVTFEKSDIDHMATFWPSFCKKYAGSSWFALIARRFYFSTMKLSIEDQLIDLMIALEALLVPGKDGSKKDKIASRMASMLKESYIESSVYELLMRAYKLRNDIVHGTRNADESEKQLVEEISMLTRKAIQQYLLHHSHRGSPQLAAWLDQQKPFEEGLSQESV
jgi:hypothetical protein